MASKTKAEQAGGVSAEAALAGILALLVDERETRASADKGARKTELILRDAGLTVEEISAVTGRKAGTVRKTIGRAREA